MKPECANVFQEFVDYDFITSLKFMDGAIESLNWLNHNTRLYFATAGSPKTVEARHRLLKDSLSWYTSSQLIRIEDKFLLDADYLIDDCPDNFYNFKGTSILYRRPWNQHINIEGGYGMTGWGIGGLKFIMKL